MYIYMYTKDTAAFSQTIPVHTDYMGVDLPTYLLPPRSVESHSKQEKSSGSLFLLKLS